MRHVTLTCSNHPNLRWSCKEIAWSNGYNGSRGISYSGEPTGEIYSDRSGSKCVVRGPECSCSANDLILAPEDSFLATIYQTQDLIFSPIHRSRWIIHFKKHFEGKVRDNFLKAIHELTFELRPNIEIEWTPNSDHPQKETILSLFDKQHYNHRKVLFHVSNYDTMNSDRHTLVVLLKPTTKFNEGELQALRMTL